MKPVFTKSSEIIIDKAPHLLQFLAAAADVFPAALSLSVLEVFWLSPTYVPK